MADFEDMDDTEEEIDKTTQDAMSILIAAGDARNSVKEAYDAMAEGDFAAAQEKIDEADKQIVEAHHVQTDHIQGVFRGEGEDYSLLFTHAQDTLMTIYSEIITAKRLYTVFSSIDTRLKKLEGEQ
ncbi:MAG: PTS lactose/cellobiose transporter subunit IIA [Olsenella sp.]|jgi:PTS system cellobiose-specific IIA component|nr:PTS lactose/cellobiose transporter subunit IIA [Olsenella sp.]